MSDENLALSAELPDGRPVESGTMRFAFGSMKLGAWAKILSA
ncbi:hypothetical protein [Methylorubrum extorquens]|nr:MULTISPECIES: hypothetical protein [Methylobacteriaceae]